MAHRAILDLVFVDAELLNQLLASLNVVRWQLILHVEHFAQRPDIFFRIAMAGQTEKHFQSLRLIRERHFVDAAVARYAANPLVHVGAVVEIDEIRDFINPRPSKRLARSVALANELQKRAIGPNLGMASKASFRRRYPCERPLFYRRMAIPAIDSQLCRVVFVAKGDGLVVSRIKAVRVRRDIRADEHDCHQQQTRKQERVPGEIVAPLVKNVRHVVPPAHTPRTAMEMRIRSLSEVGWVRDPAHCRRNRLSGTPSLLRLSQWRPGKSASCSSARAALLFLQALEPTQSC